MKNLKRVALVLMAVVLLTVLCSCGGGKPASMVGRWKCTNANDLIKGMMSMTDLGGISVEANVYADFSADNTFSMTVEASVMGFSTSEQMGSGTYTYNNGKLTLTIEGESYTTDVNGNSFKITAPVSTGINYSLEFKKQ